MDITLIALSVFGLSFFVAYIYTARQLKIITQNLAETMLLYIASTDTINESKEPQVDSEKIHKESFIKFLSDSRDWAFDYIEKTQQTITHFIEEVEPQIEYYNEYGAAIEGMISPHDTALKKISKEIKELKKLLPEETDDRR